MDPTSILPPVAFLVLALFVSIALMRRAPQLPASDGRNASIDGLRGYLAFFVFMHHSCIWYFYLRTGQWTAPPSRVYQQFGQGSVTLFFMITGFLFFSKILHSKSQRIDWTALLYSRIMRLTPMYVFVLCALLVVVAIASPNGLVETPAQLVKNIVKWLSFTILGTPDINGINDTALILAGVTWTLPYEWTFYLSLPLLAVVAFRIPATSLVLGSFVAVCAIGLIWQPELGRTLPFLSGIFAAVATQSLPFRLFCKTTAASVIVLACLLAVAIAFDTAFDVGALLLLTIAFSLVAGGNSLFGALTAKVSLFLGEQTYSIYLLHGLLLYVTFNFIFGLPTSRLFTPLQFWGVVGAVTPVLILISRFTFLHIEAPWMAPVHAFTARRKLRGSTIPEGTTA